MRILVVDDEQLHRESLVALLEEKLPGAAPETAANGRQGLALLTTNVFDVALVDIRMPIMSGLEMIAAYREHCEGEEEDVKFVLLSGYGEFAYAQEAIKLGVKRYLLKPVDVDELDRLFEELVGGETRSGKSQLSHLAEPHEDNDAFAQTLVYINQHYMHPLSLEELARMAYFSVSYYCAIFKRRMGISFNKYLLNVRMKHAEQLLSTSQLKVYEIAQQVGYQDVKYFTRLFKAAYQMTPDEYRRQAIAAQLRRHNQSGGDGA